MPASAYLATNVTLEVRLEGGGDGLLLFAGQRYGRDFLSLTKQGPAVVLRSVLLPFLLTDA